MAIGEAVRAGREGGLWQRWCCEIRIDGGEGVEGDEGNMIFLPVRRLLSSTGVLEAPS